jgi:hypothetical protein
MVDADSVMDTRKPLAKAEPAAPQVREPHSIRFTEQEWDAIREGARRRGLEPAVFTRMLALHALRIAEQAAAMEASLGMLPEVLPGSRRVSGF